MRIAKRAENYWFTQWFSTRNNFAHNPHPWGYLAMSGDIFGCYTWGVQLARRW